MTAPENSDSRRFLFPADYYSIPARNPVLPRWAAYGCGGAAVVFLALLFAAGAYLSAGGFTKLMDFTFGMSLGEIRGMYGDDVTAARKKSLEREVERMRELLRAERVELAEAQSVLQLIQKAITDGVVTADEAKRLERAVMKINENAADRNRR